MPSAAQGALGPLHSREDQKMSTPSLNRRRLLQAGLAGALAPLALRAGAQSLQGLTIGIVYVGPRTDFGWNASHFVGVGALKTLPGVKVVEQERVPETRLVVEVMESMIQTEGARLILGTSYGYFNPFMVDLAKKYPKVEFRHSTTLWEKDKHPSNLGGYFCYLDQAHYIDGVAAGLCTKSGKLGFVAAKPIPLVLRNINSDMVQNTPSGAGATEPARKAALQAIADLKANKPIFTGTYKDNTGKVVLNKTYDNYDPYLDQMNYLLEGIVGSIT